ncbi:MAG: hypothetical protein PHT84_04585 [Candidatus Pacebacteria bacterium]|nr:hypothetical protein [Candidatus Paceibacterota bacterium]
MIEKIKKPIVFAILDGFGVAGPNENNFIKNSKTKNFDFFVREYPAFTLYSDSRQVGLSENQKGNSLIGHLSIGAGRVCYSTREKINKMILDKNFFENKSLQKAVEHIKINKSNLHLIGFLGLDQEFSDEKHLFALFDFCKKNHFKNVFLHVILDIDNTMDENNKKILLKLQEKLKKYDFIKIASLSSQYFAMDTDMHWDRTEKMYQTICDDEKIKSFFIEKILNDFEILESGPVRINSSYNFSAKDVLIFFNHSSSGMRQILKSFSLPNFIKFPLKHNHKDNLIITLTEYEKELPVLVAFPKFLIYNSLAEIIDKNDLSQYHITSGEKFSNINYYLNGRSSEIFEGETDEMIEIKEKDNYENYLKKITNKISNKVISHINNDDFDIYFINYPILELAVDFLKDEKEIKNCVEYLDKQLGKIVDYCLAKDGTCFMTSSYVKKEIVGLENCDKVPFLIIKNELRGKKLKNIDPVNEDLSLVSPVGSLVDIAPTILSELDIEIPNEMTGKSLLN